MLNAVLCKGVRVRVLKQHWLKALDAATIIVPCGPMSSNDAKSTAYDTDIVELLVRSGRCTLRTAVADERITRTISSNGLSSWISGRHVANTTRPTRMTPVT